METDAMLFGRKFYIIVYRSHGEEKKTKKCRETVDWEQKWFVKLDYCLEHSRLNSVPFSFPFPFSALGVTPEATLGDEDKEDKASWSIAEQKIWIAAPPMQDDEDPSSATV
jgi:hypothetical protein